MWFAEFVSLIGFAMVMPFLPFYVEDLGISDPDQIKFWAGLIVSAQAVTMAIFAPIWGSVADTLAARQKQPAEESVHLRLLRWAMLGSAICAWLVGQTSTFWTLLISVAVFNIAQSAVMPLGDGVAATAAAKQNVPYGSIRLWGSLGFAITSLALGQIVNQFDLSLGIMFVLHQLQLRQERLVLDTEGYVDEHLLQHLQA